MGSDGDFEVRFCTMEANGSEDRRGEVLTTRIQLISRIDHLEIVKPIVFLEE